MFQLTADQKLLQDEARDLAEGHVRARAAEVDRTEEYPWDTTKKLTEAGFMLALGPLPIFLAIGGLATTILLGLGLGRFFGRPAAFGILTGGAVGICGASAALALTSVLPKGERGISERDTIFTVVAVTALSTVAMKTSLKDFFEVGPRAMAIIVAETVWIAAFAAIVLSTLA